MNCPRISEEGEYHCPDYEMDKKTLQNAGLTADEYEKAVKEMCKRNGF